jgi:hypothetical protein
MSLLQLVGGHNTNSTLSSAVGIAIPAGANCIILQATAQNVRVRFDGVVPTATSGFQINVNQYQVRIDLPATAFLYAIEETASARLDYQFAWWNGAS